MNWEISIKNDVDELGRVAALVDSIADELRFSSEQRMDIGLALDEVASNIIFYAYPDGMEATIDLKAESDGQKLTFVLSDQGREFDPTKVVAADMGANPAERPLGGMGIFIVKNIMNQVSYQRLQGNNQLTMTYAAENGR